ncbi:hypothetical protein A2U01_0082824 [Trifolium medium]|uniref:Uncharacterized protein n=1 Tax=Trifolium medium TaxID=97028 RepID=A0A392TM95_9FABA|nr:hypothetical protein [Trifolium medium]
MYLCGYRGDGDGEEIFPRGGDREWGRETNLEAGCGEASSAHSLPP